MSIITLWISTSRVLQGLLNLTCLNQKRTDVKECLPLTLKGFRNLDLFHSALLYISIKTNAMRVWVQYADTTLKDLLRERKPCQCLHLTLRGFNSSQLTHNVVCSSCRTYTQSDQDIRCKQVNNICYKVATYVSYLWNTMHTNDKTRQ